MVTLMNDDELITLEQVCGFLDGTQPVTFEIRGKDACYAWIERTLLRFRYRRLSRAEKGLLVRYLMKVSGYSRQQITRLIGQYHKHGGIRRPPAYGQRLCEALHGGRHPPAGRNRSVCTAP